MSSLHVVCSPAIAAMGPRQAAGTRCRPREAQAAPAQSRAESRTQGHVARRSRPRVHADLVTVAIRGHFAERMRALSETHGMSLAKILKDSLLVYEGQIDAGYEPGTSLRGWQESVAQSEQHLE